MVLCSVFSYILNLSIYVQYYILAVKNICKNKTFVHPRDFPLKIISLSFDSAIHLVFIISIYAVRPMVIIDTQLPPSLVRIQTNH